jgi:hypothetical protein
MFDPIWKLALGLGTGVIFGLLLQKGQVTKYRTIVGQFLLRDFTLLKIMLTAVVVGGLGVYGLAGLDLATLHIKPLLLAGVVVGGLIFGVGMALLGYCPGPAVAAVAEGSRHAVFGVLGMLFGAAVYAEVYGPIKSGLLTVGDYGKITLAELTGLSPWVVLAGIALAALLLFAAVERWERGRKPAATVPVGTAPSTGDAAGSA